MEFKGTKGEWFISPSDENYITDITDNFAIAKVFNNSFIQKGESEANAKLIAVAPLMLEMLKILLGDIKTKIADSPAKDNRVHQVEQLIKKATE